MHLLPNIIIRVASAESGIRNVLKYEDLYGCRHSNSSAVLRHYWGSMSDPVLLYYQALGGITAWNLTAMRRDYTYDSWPILTETEVEQIFL